MGDASLSAGDTCGGVEESRDEPRGAASSESTEGGNSQSFMSPKQTHWWWNDARSWYNCEKHRRSLECKLCTFCIFFLNVKHL